MKRLFFLAAVLAACGCNARGLHPNPDPAILNCRDALERLKTPPPGKTGFGVFVDGCKDIYVEAECRDAFVDAVSTARDERIALIFEACRDAYCPSFDEPPASCAKDYEMITDYDRMLGWSELNQAILARDLGGRRAGRISGELSVLSAINDPDVLETPP